MQLPYSETNAGLHYDLRLEIDPNSHYVAVSGSAAYHSPLHRLERARFYLHRQFNVHRLEGKRVEGYHFETGTQPEAPFMPQAGILDVYFNPSLGSGETTLISFDYDGYITDWPAESANVVTPEWTELGLYLPWFPFQFNGALSDLTFTLKVRVPPGFQVSSYGPAALLGDGSYYFQWTQPTSDIVVAAGEGLQTHAFESGANHIYLSTSTFSDAAAAQMGETLLWTLERYSGWFGPTRPSDFTVIESPRPLGGGYARRGLVVLGGMHERDFLDQPAAYLRYLSHEIAHAWWWDAPTTTWEDWLNESFAEYSALLAVRERFGAEIFERFLERKRERADNGLPLWGFDRADVTTPEKQSNVERMLYDKGPLLLDDLARRIGHSRFLELCRARIWSGVTTTPHLLDLLAEVEDEPTRDWMEQRLKTG